MFRKNTLSFVAVCALALPLLAGADAGVSNADFDELYRAYENALEADESERTVTLARELYAAGPARFGEDSESVAALAVNLGRALTKTGETEAAREVLEEARDRYRAIDRQHPDLVEVHLAMGRNWAKDWQREGKARREYGKAIRLAESLHGEDSVEAALVELRVGIDLLEDERSRRAGAYLEDAWDVLDPALGPTHLRTGEAAFYRGKYELMRKRPEEAEAWFDRALVAFPADDTASETMQLTTRAFLVEALERQGKRDQATQHCLAIGRMSPVDPDRERKPLFKTQGDFLDMMNRSVAQEILEHHGGKAELTIAFTVDEMGFVRDPRVVRNDLNPRFAERGMEVIQAFRYAPSFEDGEPVSSEDSYSMNFEITRNPR